MEAADHFSGVACGSEEPRNSLTKGISRRELLTGLGGCEIACLAAVSDKNATDELREHAAASFPKPVDRAFLYLTSYGAKLDGVTDDSAAWKAAIAAAEQLNIQTIIIPWGATGVSLVANPIVSGELPPGITFEGEGRNCGNEYQSGVTLKYTGAGTCWGIKYTDYAPPETGRWSWRNLAFKATNGAATMFDFNDTLTHTPVDSGGYSYLLHTRFESCYFEGAMAGVGQTGDAIRGAKLFHLVVDENCHIRGWRRGVWLKGCDNCVISPRAMLNARNVMIEKSGTFGNNSRVGSRHLGPTRAFGGDAPYHLYDSGQSTVIDVGLVEHFGGVAGDCTGLLYLNGLGTRINAPELAGAGVPIFELGPSSRNCVMSGPIVTTSTAASAPVIATPVSWDWGYTQEDHRLVVRNASGNFQAVVGRSPRILYQRPMRGSKNLADQEQPMLSDTNGYQPAAHRCSALNYWGKSFGTSVSGGIAGIEADALAPSGYAIRLNKNTANAGFEIRLVCGRDFLPGWLKIRSYTRAAAPISIDTWRGQVLKNGVFIQNHTLPTTTTYTLTDTGLNASTWALGDVLTFYVQKVGSPDQDLMIEYLDIIPVAAAIADGTLAAALMDLAGGATTDAEARTAINATMDAVRVLETKLNALLALERRFGKLAE